MANLAVAALAKGSEMARHRQRVVLPLVMLASIGLFLPSVQNYFMGEDFSFLYQMSQFRSWRDSFAVYEGFYRPVHVLFRYLEYRVSGLEPAGYHVISLGLHAAVTGLTFVLLHRMGLSLAWAGAGGILFGIHYAHSESLMHAIATHDPLMTLFLLVVLLLVQRRTTLEGGPAGREALWSTVGALAAFAAAFFTKETALVFPIIVVAYDYLLVRREGEGLRETLVRQWPFLALAFVLFGGRYVVLAGIEGYPIRWRLGIFLENALRYLEHLSVPLPIIDSPSYQTLFAGMKRLLEGRRLLQFAILAGGAAAVGALARAVLRRGGSRYGRLILFGGLWVVVVVIMVSPVFADRNTYLPSVGFVLVWTAAFSAWAERAAGLLRKAIPWIAGLYIFLMGMGAYQRVLFYQHAGDFSKRVVSELRAAVASLPPGCLMYLINAPEIVMSPTGSTWQTLMQFGGEEAVRVLDGKDIYIRQNSRIFNRFRTIKSSEDLLQYLEFMGQADAMTKITRPEKRLLFAYLNGRIMRVNNIYEMDWSRTGLRYVLKGDGSFRLAPDW